MDWKTDEWIILLMNRLILILGGIMRLCRGHIGVISRATCCNARLADTVIPAQVRMEVGQKLQQTSFPMRITNKRFRVYKAFRL